MRLRHLEVGARAGHLGDAEVEHLDAGRAVGPLRQRLRQYVNLRPMRLMPGISSPLANRTAADIDMICVRENSEGEYCGIGGRLHVGTPDELAEQTSVFTRRGIERIAVAACAAQAAGSSGGAIAVHELSGSKLWIASTAVAVSSPRSFWKTIPSWLTMKVCTPLEP